ncbi:hypothetical protein LZ32DRAFT_166875 [Colletotrichum eremochloae]|nr:hypothetical protein LZ32DRAFT_166875 [Colletotrichum eremochloae]
MLKRLVLAISSRHSHYPRLSSFLSTYGHRSSRHRSLSFALCFFGSGSRVTRWSTRRLHGPPCFSMPGRGASCFDVESRRRPPTTNNNNSNQSVHNYYPCSLIPFTTFTTPPPRLWPSPLCLAAAWSTW